MSILAVDFGSVHTRALLIDQVNGEYQLVGVARTRTTDSFPAQNVTVGLTRVLNLLRDATGRTFVNPDGRVITPEQPDRSGVDTFVITASGGRPLRAVVVGLMPDFSVASALKALSNTYVNVTETVHLADGRSLEDRLNTVLHAFPDIIFVVGGTDGGATNASLSMIQTVRLAVSLMDRRRRPTVIYAGNAGLTASVITQFEGVADVLLADNVRADLETEAIEPARAVLARAFNHYTELRGYGFSELPGLANGEVMPSARGYVTIADYLARVRKMRVLALDVGSGAVTLAYASPKDSLFSIRTDLGLGQNAQSLLAAVGVDAVLRYLPFEARRSEIRDYAANKVLRPALVPADLRAMYIEHALLRAAAALMAENTGIGGAPEADMLILGGAAINDTGSARFTALLGLDTLGMSGVTRLYADPYGLTAALGAVAASRSEAVVQVLDEGGYAELGTAVCVSGRARPEKPALRVTLEQRGKPKRKYTVNGGHIMVVPLGIGERVKLSVQALGGLTVNGRRSLKTEVIGGSVGLVLDARGRPLLRDSTVKQRAEWMPLWLSEITEDEKHAIPEGWLTPLDEPDLTLETPARRRKNGNKRRDKGAAQPAAEAASEDVSLDDLRNI